MSPVGRCKRRHRLDNWRQYGHKWECLECNRIKAKAKRLRARRIREGQEVESRREGFPVGYHHFPARQAKRIPEGYYSNDSIREAVMHSMRRDPDLSFGEIATRCGWTTRGHGGDTTRVERLLGMRLYSDRKLRAGVAYRQSISEADAILILRAIHVAPWEVGL